MGLGNTGVKSRGGNNDDVIVNNGGSGVLKGGRGNDTYFISTTGVTVDEKNNAGNDTIVSDVDYQLDANVENLILNGQDDIDGTGNELDNLVIGNSGSNVISGLEGNDWLEGGDGDDTLFGGIGDDQLYGGTGSNSIDGGDGTDVAYFSGAAGDHSFTWVDALLWVTGASGETSVLEDVEFLAFDDQTVAVSDVQDTEADTTQPPVAPLAAEDVAHDSEDQSVTIHVLENDIGDGITVASATNGSFGSVSINADNTLTYTPEANAFGTDVIAYTIVDNAGRTSEASVTIYVEAVNDAPQAHDDSFFTSADSIFDCPQSVLDNDHDEEGSPLEILGFDATTGNGGSVQMNPDGTFSYSTPEGFIGTDTFAYTVSDDQGAESTAEVSIIVESNSSGGSSGGTQVGDNTNPDIPSYVYDGLLGDDTQRLNADQEMGTGKTVTYAFAETTPDYYSADSVAYNDFQTFTEAQQAAATQILSEIEQFSGLSFFEVSSPEEADIVFGAADLGVPGVAYFPDGNDSGEKSADVWLASYFSGQSFEPGTQGHFVLMHEIGHALGLDHADFSVEEENQQYTIMTAFGHPSMYVEPSTFMSYDIAAIQHLYGYNIDSANPSDTIYTFEEFDDQVRTIWDQSGIDTIDMSAADYGTEINLKDGSFSTISSYGNDNIGLSYGSIIENVIGGSYDDHIIGNSADNTFTGGDGSDVFGFSADWGQDTITDFSRGNDILDFSGSEISLSDLEILYENGSALIMLGENTLHLEELDEELDETDFLFA